jgi:hypothetical protein
MTEAQWPRMDKFAARNGMLSRSIRDIVSLKSK